MDKDRRTRRTKKLLTEAFIELLSEKKLNEITIKELCEKADINRGTFYLHYEDIYDLKNQIETDLCDELINQIQPITNANMKELDSYQLFYQLFTYTKKNETLFRALLGDNGDISFLTDLRILFKEYYLSPVLKGQPINFTQNMEYAYDFISSGFTGLVAKWLEEGTPYSVDEMAKLTSKLAFDGIPALLLEV